MKEEKNFKSTSNYQLEFFKYTLEKALKKNTHFRSYQKEKTVTYQSMIISLAAEFLFAKKKG